MSIFSDPYGQVLISELDELLTELHHSIASGGTGVDREPQSVLADLDALAGEFRAHAEDDDDDDDDFDDDDDDDPSPGGGGGKVVPIRPRAAA